MTVASTPARADVGRAAGEWSEVDVVGLRRLTADVVALVLRGDPTARPWEPGAHVDVELPSGDVRQYSLCGDPTDDSGWEIAVRRAEDGRGGSASAHRDVRVGTRLRVRGPRTTFGWAPAARYLFVAGGIGITPLRPMIHAALARGAEVELAYAGRSRSTMPFLAELEAVLGDRIRVHPSDEGPRLDVAAVVGAPRSDTLVYCCGPDSLLSAVGEAARDWPAGAIRCERFAPAEVETATDDAPFEVECAASGIVVTVEPGGTVLDAVLGAGVFADSSCREGTCGSCEVTVLGGEVDHRDAILTPEDRETGDSMMICVSRCRSPRLVLDL